MPMDVETYRALGLDQPTPDEVNGRSNRDVLTALNHQDDLSYKVCEEATADVGTRGTYHKFEAWQSQQCYPGTERNIGVYVPRMDGPQADKSNVDRPVTDRPGTDRDDHLNLIVFNDGAGYASLSGQIRATRVLDTLIANGELQPTVGVFINPGVPSGDDNPSASTEYTPAMVQRSFEYDSLTPHYGKFLLEEVLPFVTDELDLQLSQDPRDRAVCGISSGGICAFSVAWFHTESFQRVISHCGSYTNIRGGHNYPYLVQTTPRKPLRVYLQSGQNDAQTLFGHWPTANMAMAEALSYAGYDYRFEFGQGGHSLRHGGRCFADTLRWLFEE